MTTDDGYVPDWDSSDTWQESEWEAALKYSDHLASRYFRMLERFDDLPNAEELIAAKLGKQNFFQLEDVEYSSEWWDDPDDFDDMDPDTADDELEVLDRIERGDALFFETSPVYTKSRQITLGWCNIVGSALLPADRFWGIRVLFQLGRLVSYLSLSIGDGTFDNINASIIFAKRSLFQINQIIGDIEAKSSEVQQYRPMFNIVNTYLLENHDLVVDYLLDCNKRQKDDKKQSDR